MNCKTVRSGLLEAARCGADVPPEHSGHLRECAGCAEYYREQRALTRAMASVVSADSAATAQMEARLLAEFDAALARPPRFSWKLAAAALTACAAAGLALIHQPAPEPPRAAEAPFLEIPYTAPLAPYEVARVERMDIPLAALVAAGFDVRATDFGASVRADVLFGQDGRAHAIRLVSPQERRIIQ